jgi:predicted transcriptional regulator
MMNNGSLRDDFLVALEAGDGAASVRLAGFLMESTNLLPSTVCAQLGLPPGSAYAAAARSVLAKYATA